MKKKIHKIIICICLFVMLFTTFSNVFAETNPNYTPDTKVSESALDQKIKSATLLDALSSLINALASLAESLIGALFSALTGDNIFPWADRIIFNSIGFLDINFLNPASNSLFVKAGTDGKTLSILGEVIKNVYSTIFSLAVLFLGVAVGIMAIRLAISSIASEKAKYKQAIVNWATCIVMLFMMHYILAFVFWVNEQLVVIASGILTDTIDKKGLNTIDFKEALNSVLKPEDRINNFKASMGASNEIIFGDENVIDRLLTNNDYMDNRIVYFEQDTSNNLISNTGQFFGMTKQQAKDIGLLRIQNDANAAHEIYITVGEGQPNQEQREQKINEAKKNGYYYCSTTNRKIYFDEDKYVGSEDYRKDLAALVYIGAGTRMGASETKIYEFYRDNPQLNAVSGHNPNLWTWAFGWLWPWGDFSQDTTFSLSISELEAELDESVRKNMIATRLKNDGYLISAAFGKTTSSATDIIANLGSFFKQSAFVYTAESVDNGDGQKITGWRASKVSVTGALLYAIFIFQSCIYLIMYVKRLFYVMMLSMFGPIVVIYDFFTKSV